MRTKSKIFVTILCLMSAGAYAADATSVSEAAAGSVAGVVNETPITMDSHSTTKVLDLVAMQVAPLPTTLVSASGRVEKYGDCGPRVVIDKFTRATHHSKVLGVIPGTDDWASMHGIWDNTYDTKNPYVVRSIKLPAPFEGEEVELVGHQIYITVETVGAGGGGSGTGNYTSDNRYLGLGASGNANSAFMVVGAVALDCVKQKKGTPAPVPALPKNKCTTKDGKSIFYDGAKPAECNG